jgi:hypothetical protein
LNNYPAYIPTVLWKDNSGVLSISGSISTTLLKKVNNSLQKPFKIELIANVDELAASTSSRFQLGVHNESIKALDL